MYRKKKEGILKTIKNYFITKKHLFSVKAENFFFGGGGASSAPNQYLSSN